MQTEPANWSDPSSQATISARLADPGHLILQVAGEIDLANAAAVAEALQRSIPAEPPPVVIDLRDLTFLDLAGSRAIQHALAASAAPYCCLVEPGSIPDRLLQLLHPRLLPSAASLDQALALATTSASARPGQPPHAGRHEQSGWPDPPPGG